MRKLTTISITLLAIALSSCANTPKAPEGHIGIINAHPSTAGRSPYILEFDLAQDFDANGSLKSGVKGVSRAITLDDLHKYWAFDTPTKENIQAYILKWKQRYQQLQKECNQ